MKTPARPLIADEAPKKHASELRVRTDRDATPTPEVGRKTREADAAAGDEGYASHVSEIRRLYAEGEVDAALDLASMVSPTTMAFSLHSVPVVVLTPQEIVALPLDSRSGFLLARIDGTSTLQTLLDVSAMPWGEAMSLLEELLALGAVRLLPPPVTDSSSMP
ncbi:MAG: hypothetical protein JWP87_3777 [Labilithrix sp.]|jgi:hypothetical protein|nr:hypothetical protein [Labilithrix sp.]